MAWQFCWSSCAFDTIDIIYYNLLTVIDHYLFILTRIFLIALESLFHSKSFAIQPDHLISVTMLTGTPFPRTLIAFLELRARNNLETGRVKDEDVIISHCHMHNKELWYLSPTVMLFRRASRWSTDSEFLEENKSLYMPCQLRVMFQPLSKVWETTHRFGQD